MALFAWIWESLGLAITGVFFSFLILSFSLLYLSKTIILINSDN